MKKNNIQYKHLNRGDVVMTAPKNQIVDSTFPFSIYNGRSWIGRIRSPATFSDPQSEPDLHFGKTRIRIQIRYEWYGVICKSISEMGTEPISEPDSESNRIGSGCGVLVFRTNPVSVSIFLTPPISGQRIRDGQLGMEPVFIIFNSE